jgi:hypothetical protein
MKHINNWKLFESEDGQEQEPEMGSKNIYQGFCLTASWAYDRSDVATLMVAASCLTLQEFMNHVWTEFGGDEDEDLSDLRDISDLMNRIADDMEIYPDSELWCGLEPKKQESDMDSSNLSNPMVASNILNSMFSNATEIMGSNNKSLKDNENMAIARSIENSPELISLYVNSPRFEGIKKFVNLDDKKIDLLINYYQNIKGMI